MKYTFWILFIMFVLIEIQMIGLIYLHKKNLEIWHTQLKVNDSVYEALTI